MNIPAVPLTRADCVLVANQLGQIIWPILLDPWDRFVVLVVLGDSLHFFESDI